MLNPIRLGIVGIGRAGWGMHCGELESRKDMFKVVAACDLIEERRNKMAEKYGCGIYDNIEDLLKDENIEMVDIATRSCDHFKHAIMALEAGKDVFLEKPMCETYEEALKLKELSTKPNGPRIFTRHNRRFEGDFLRIQEIIRSGILGEVYEIHITRNGYSRRDDWQTIKKFGGGQLLNWGPHIIDHSLRFLESPVENMYSELRHITATGDCEDHIKIIFRGENGRIVDMQISGGVAIKCPEYTVFGSRGGLEIVDKQIKLRYIDPNQKLETKIAKPETPGQSFGATGTFSSEEKINWIEETEPVPPENISVIWDHLYSAYREGKEFPIHIDEAIEVIKVISEAKKNTEFEK